jgi:GNAT superfamily N-acetyltransferase
MSQKNDYEYRVATPAEGYAFLRLVVSHIGDAEAARSLPDEPAFFYLGHEQWCGEAAVATHHGVTVGVATLFFDGLMRRGPPTLATLYVLPEHRSAGIGSRLLRMALERFAARGRTPVRVDAATEAMHRRLEELPPDLRGQVKETASYRGGDLRLDWESDLRP